MLSFELVTPRKQTRPILNISESVFVAYNATTFWKKKNEKFEENKNGDREHVFFLLYVSKEAKITYKAYSTLHNFDESTLKKKKKEEKKKKKQKEKIRRKHLLAKLTNDKKKKEVRLK